MTRAKPTYPNNLFVHGLRDAGVVAQVMWQMRGPKDTGIAWIEAILAGHRIFHVVTYHDMGWDVLGPISDDNTLDAPVKAALRLVQR